MTVTFTRTVDQYRSGESAVVSVSLGRGLINLGHAYETSVARTPTASETATRFLPKPSRRKKK
jgi:hypothetical protein